MTVPVFFDTILHHAEGEKYSKFPNRRSSQSNIFKLKWEISGLRDRGRVRKKTGRTMRTLSSGN